MSSMELGRRMVTLRTAILERLGRSPAPAPVDVVPRGVKVGVCGSCMGDVRYDPETRSARCPCGDTKIPRRFIAWGAASAKPGPR